MVQEALADGWVLYGKTGNGSQLAVDGHKIKDRQVGWFVGFLRKEETTITFVQLIVDEDKQDTYASLRARSASKKTWQKLLSDPVLLLNENNSM